MKKWIAAVSILFVLCMLPNKAYADSPITATVFFTAYEDVAIISEARSSGVVDQEIADYLADENNPIDIKAAIINALSWDLDNKNNAELYSRYIYNTSFEDMDLESLRGDQLFCLGYLKALDNYFDVEPSLVYLRKAEELMPDSFTVAMIRSLAEAMKAAEQNLWEVYTLPVLNDSSLTMDMRQEAVTVITDYMVLYSGDWVQDIPKTGERPTNYLWGIGALVMAAGIYLLHRKIKNDKNR